MNNFLSSDSQHIKPMGFCLVGTWWLMKTPYQDPSGFLQHSCGSGLRTQFFSSELPSPFSHPWWGWSSHHPHQYSTVTVGYVGRQVLASLLLCDSQLLIQLVVLGLLQCRALGVIMDSPYSEGEIVISPHLAVILHGFSCENIAQIMVVTDQHHCNVLVNGH